MKMREGGERGLATDEWGGGNEGCRDGTGESERAM